jgi:hypothetical protein
MTWLNIAFSNCYEIYFNYSCMIIAVINQIYYYGYVLLDTKNSCEQSTYIAMSKLLGGVISQSY